MRLLVQCVDEVYEELVSVLLQVPGESVSARGAEKEGWQVILYRGYQMSSE